MQAPRPRPEAERQRAPERGHQDHVVRGASSSTARCVTEGAARTLPHTSQGCPPLPLALPQRSAQRGHKDTSSRLGALLTILCSRTALHTIPSAPSTSHTLARLLRLLYLSEAQLHLTDLHLPLPADAVVPSDVDLRTEASALEFLNEERQAHDRTRERLRQAQVGLEKATSSGTAARTKADKSEAEAKSLRGEVSRLKGECEILKDQAREGFKAKDDVLRDVDRLKEDVERHRREAQGASVTESARGWWRQSMTDRRDLVRAWLATASQRPATRSPAHLPVRRPSLSLASLAR